MNKKTLHIVIQLVAGALVFAAVGTQLALQFEYQQSIVNFFSFFTNLSNILAGFVLLYGAVLLIQNKTSKVYDVVRGASVVYMAVVGVVFSLLLSGAELGILQPWVNTVLHYIMPVVVVAYWFINPPKNKIATKTIGYWLIFPAAYLFYSLVRGAIVNWYPYPFLNPSQDGGYGMVALYSLLVLVFFIVFSLAIRWASNVRTKKKK